MKHILNVVFSILVIGTLPASAFAKLVPFDVPCTRYQISEEYVFDKETLPSGVKVKKTDPIYSNGSFDTYITNESSKVLVVPLSGTDAYLSNGKLVTNFGNGNTNTESGPALQRSANTAFMIHEVVPQVISRTDTLPHLAPQPFSIAATYDDKVIQITGVIQYHVTENDCSTAASANIKVSTDSPNHGRWIDAVLNFFASLKFW